VEGINRVAYSPGLPGGGGGGGGGAVNGAGMGVLGTGFWLRSSSLGPAKGRMVIRSVMG
jgi:hypothetical protein